MASWARATTTRSGTTPERPPSGSTSVPGGRRSRSRRVTTTPARCSTPASCAAGATTASGSWARATPRISATPLVRPPSRSTSGRAARRSRSGRLRSDLRRAGQRAAALLGLQHRRAAGPGPQQQHRRHRRRDHRARSIIGPGRTAVAVSAGGYHICAIAGHRAGALLGLQQLRAAGARADTAVIGDDPGETTVAVDLGPGRTARAVNAGAYHNCAMLDTGQLRCWGRNDFGQLGQGNTPYFGDSPGETTVAVDLGPRRTALAVAEGEFHTCAVTRHRQVRCWGWNALGQLGQGNTIDFGNDPGETPAALPPINLGGQLVGRDTDRTACGTRSTRAPPCPARCRTAARQRWRLRKLCSRARWSSSTPCWPRRRPPRSAPPRPRWSSRPRAGKDKIKVTKQLKTKTVATGCRVKGKVNLHAKPKKTAKVKVTITGHQAQDQAGCVAVRL